MLTRRKSVRSRASVSRFGIEGLERRDCPAVVSIVGPSEVGEAGASITLTATLSEPQAKPVEVSYFTAGTATAGQDYRLMLGSAAFRTPSGTITFRPGVTSVPITFTPLNDTLREPDEAFQINLISARGHTLGAKAVTITIRDDDSYTAAITGPTLVSADSITRFTLQLSSPATRTETFFVSTEDRSATTARDYGSLKNLPVTFLPGQSSRDFSVVTRQDVGSLPDRSFVITVRPQAAGVPDVAPYTVTIAGTGVPPSPPPGPALTTATFTRDYGWGVVNAAASVAKLLGGATAFAEVPDIGGVSWGNDVVRAPEVWAQGYKGRGIVVAVVDTGVDYTHPSLSSSIWVNPREIPGDGIDNDNNGFVDDVRGWDFFGNDNDPMDEFVADPRTNMGGHGTHVAGTIAAIRTEYGPAGVAFDAKIMPVRVLPAQGGGTITSVAAGIRYAATNGAHVMNLSLGSDGPGTPAEIRDAITYATSLGVIVVAAAGNFREPTPSSPASLAGYPGVVSIGAIDNQLKLSVWPQFGLNSGSAQAGIDPALKHIVAPGTSVTSTVPAGYPGGIASTSGTFASLNGTSMAAPHVSGVVALMLSALPNPRAPGVRDRVVNALVTTSQQPPALTSTTVVSASMQSAAAVATVRLPGQGAPTVRPMPLPFRAVTPALVAKPQVTVSVEVERGHHTSAARPIAFRAVAASSDVAGLQALSRLSGSRRLI